MDSGRTTTVDTENKTFTLTMSEPEAASLQALLCLAAKDDKCSPQGMVIAMDLLKRIGAPVPDEPAATPDKDE